MGPSLGRLGDCAASIAPGGRRCRNGAEPRKARRPCNNSSQAARKSSRRNGAEPRKARRLADPEENPRPSVAPQWGRASEGSETRRRRGSILRRRWRRNGAEPRKARRPAAPYSGSEQLASPQWGRASEGSETLNPMLFSQVWTWRRNGAEPRKARRPSHTPARHVIAVVGRNGAEPRKARRPVQQLGKLRKPQTRRNGAEPRKARRLKVARSRELAESWPQWGRASEGSETHILTFP